MIEYNYEYKNGIHKYDLVKSKLIYCNIKENYKHDVTIVVPTYKRDDLLIRAIKSVYYQPTNIKYELIIVDNDYRDITGTKLENLLKNMPDVSIRYYQNEKNIGLFGNWNRCFELATTKWVAMLHDDDYLLSTYFSNLEHILPLLDEKTGYVKASTKILKKNNQIGLINYNKKDMSLFGPCKIGRLGAPSCGSIFNRELFYDVGGFNEEHYPSEDAYYICKLSVKYGYDLFTTSVPMGVIDHEDSLTYKYETILKFAEEFCTYFDYYATWNKLTYFMYKFFYREIYHRERHQMKKLVINNDRITNKQSIIDDLNKVLGYDQYNKFKYFILLLIYKVHDFFIFNRKVITKNEGGKI